jgi:hypothetical protein
VFAAKIRGKSYSSGGFRGGRMGTTGVGGRFRGGGGLGGWPLSRLRSIRRSRATWNSLALRNLGLYRMEASFFGVQ